MKTTVITGALGMKRCFLNELRNLSTFYAEHVILHDREYFGGGE